MRPINKYNNISILKSPTSTPHRLRFFVADLSVDVNLEIQKINQLPGMEYSAHILPYYKLSEFTDMCFPK